MARHRIPFLLDFPLTKLGRLPDPGISTHPTLPSGTHPAFEADPAAIPACAEQRKVCPGRSALVPGACPATCPLGQASLTPISCSFTTRSCGTHSRWKGGECSPRNAQPSAHPHTPAPAGRRGDARPWDPLEAFGISARPVRRTAAFTGTFRGRCSSATGIPAAGRGGKRGIRSRILEYSLLGVLLPSAQTADA